VGDRKAGGSIRECVWDACTASTTQKALAAEGRRLAPSRGPGSGQPIVAWRRLRHALVDGGGSVILCCSSSIGGVEYKPDTHAHPTALMAARAFGRGLDGASMKQTHC